MTPTPTPDQMLNASNNINSAFADSTGLAVPFALVVYAVGILLAAQFVAPWLARSTALNRLAGGVVTSIVYAIKGAAAAAAIGLTAAPIYLLAQADGGTRAFALKWIGYAVAGYLALVVVGWLADRAVAKFIEAHPDYDEWGDLFPESNDELDEAVTDGGSPNSSSSEGGESR